jgi:hypothetical protein
VDDAYITFRYARNLAEGAGLVYNTGERVLGTSAPLFAVLLAGLHRLTGAPIPALAFGLGAACLPLVALVGYRLARRMAGPLFAALCVAIGLSPRESLRVFAYGMETPLYLLGLVLAIELLCRGRDVAAFAVAGALAFIHPDAALLVGALAVASRASGGRWPWRGMALGLAPAAAGAVALWASYGSPIPHSVTAKRAVYAEAPGTAAARLSDSVLIVTATREAPALAFGPLGAVTDLVLPSAAAVLVAVTLVLGRLRLASLPALAFALFSAAYVVAFAFGNPLVFPWYRPPLNLAAAFVVCAAVGGLGPVWRFAWAVLLAGTAVLHVAFFVPYDPAGREDVYRRAVEVLAPGPAEVILAPEIGVVGWTSRARILDSIGLVSPGALRFRASPDGSVSPRLLRETTATSLVSLGRFLWAARTLDPGSLAGWRLVARCPATAFGDTEVQVYRRKD